MSCFLIRILIKTFVPFLIYKGSYNKEHMRILTTIFFLAHFVYAFSQITGTRFAPDSTRWSQRCHISVGPGMFLNYYWHYQIKGDTVISGRYYQKIYNSNTSSIPIDTTCPKTSNLLYFDSNRVYYNTTLIYDFNLNLGDTFNLYVNGPSHNGYYPFVVSFVDSIFVGSRWRKRITLAKSGFNFSPIKWVEGIGDINYGFNSSYGSVESYIYTGGYGQLTCFSEHWQSTYGINCTFSNGTCLVGLEEGNNEMKQINLIPQPASDIMYIQSTQLVFRQEEIPIIYDISGKQHTIPMQYINKNTYKLEVSILSAGFYVVAIKTEKGVVRKKIIVQ